MFPNFSCNHCNGLAVVDKWYLQLTEEILSQEDDESNMYKLKLVAVLMFLLPYLLGFLFVLFCFL